ncbi:flagellar hook-associated protein FlgL, partial [uncultured Clostridium sp.]|uniref:flagellar hook-associated protein FlgL n=1 Tax=uncultured Clostridium sp. TaxID=59620 RepID=UPI0025FD34F5
MRMTNSMLVSNYMNNLQRNLGNMGTLQNQLATGKTIQRASENPYVAVRTMQLNNEISANKQYNTNITDTSNWLDTTDTALGQANNIMARIKELTVKAGNGSYSKDEIGAIKDEVVEKMKELGQVLNTSFDGNYIFGGTKSTSKPISVDSQGQVSYMDKNGNTFNVDANNNIINYKDKDGNPIADTKNAEIAYNQISSNLTTEISQGVTIKYNKTAVEILNYKDSMGNSANVINTLSDLVKCLDVASGGTQANLQVNGENITNASSALKAISGKMTEDITAIASNISKIRSNVGAMENRMKSAKDTNEDQNYNMTSILSETDDIDFAQKTMEYAVLQTVYTATLQTSA